MSCHHNNHQQAQQNNYQIPDHTLIPMAPSKTYALPPKSTFICKLFGDLTVLLVLFLPILLLFKFGKPYQRGFNCNDDSIRYPYLDSTISTSLLFFYSLTIPFVVICLNELLIYRNFMTNFSLSSRFFLKNYFWQVYLNLVPFLFALFTSQLITDIAKYSIGRLRPHFIDICRPSVDGVVYDRFTKCSSPETYVVDFVCSHKGVDELRLKDARLSFMSGHSSLSAVTLMYLVFYIQQRVQWQKIGLLKPLFQYLLICLVLFTGFSRISDYKHHWSDVMVGMIQGTMVAAICAYFVSDLYKPRSYILLKSEPDVAGGSHLTSQSNNESGV